MSDPQKPNPTPKVAAGIGGGKSIFPLRLGRDFRDSFTLALGTGLASGLALIFSAYCGRKLGPADYSVFITVLSLVTLGNIPAGPINTTLARFAAQMEEEGRRGALRTLFFRMVRGTAWRGLLVLVLLLPALPLLQHLLRMDSLVPLGFGYGLIYLTVMLSLPRGVLRGLQRFAAHNTQILSENGIRLVLGLALISLWPSAPMALACMILAVFLAIVLAGFQLRPIFQGVEATGADLGAARRFFGPTLLFAALFAGFHHVDILLIKALFPPEPAGQYAAAATLARGVGILVAPFRILLLPRLVSQRSQGRPVRGLLFRLLGLFCLISGSVLGLFWVAGDFLIHGLLGADFADAVPLLVPLTLSLILINLAGLLIQPLLAEGRFSFLWFYGPLLLVEAGAIYAFHPSLVWVSWMLVPFGAVASAVLLLWLVVHPARPRGPQ